MGEKNSHLSPPPHQPTLTLSKHGGSLNDRELITLSNARSLIRRLHCRVQAALCACSFILERFTC